MTNSANSSENTNRKLAKATPEASSARPAKTAENLSAQTARASQDPASQATSPKNQASQARTSSAQTSSAQTPQAQTSQTQTSQTQSAETKHISASDPEAKKSQEKDAPAKARLLLVDDNPDNLRLLSRMLVRKSYSTELAYSGREALSMARSLLPDLILLDITMPGMDGYEVCQRLKVNPNTREIPVIFISALSEVMDKVRAFGAGGVDYITKPFQFAEVLARVENHLTLQRLRRQLAEKNDRLEAEVQERRRAELALQEKEEYLRLIIENIPQQVFWKDTDLVFRGYNHNWAEAVGLDRLDGAIGKTDYDVFSPPKVAEAFHQQDRKILETDRPIQFVVKKKVRRRTGKELVWLDIKKLPIHDEDGSVIGVLGVVEDITERRNAERDLQAEQQRTETLLLNILPQAIVDRLKTVDGSIADRFDEATVLFADIVGFTGMSAKIPPTRVVNMLNDIFSAFDRLAGDHELEKIKTIGDAYMVAGGIPLACKNHVDAVANMALDMLSALDEMRDRLELPLQIRIGINTGPVVAGVIGVKKFIYDLWGDTVNVASRMEATGEPNRIQVTEAIYERLKDRFEFEQRGTVEVKGKGTMRTYWLVGARRDG